MVIEILIEVALSIGICSAVAYFFFLNDPIDERVIGEDRAGGVWPGSGSAAHSTRGASSFDRSRRQEGAMWCNVFGRWVALLVLGGGSTDRDVWTDRIAYFIDRAARKADEAMKRRTAQSESADGAAPPLRMRPELVRLTRMELGGGGLLSVGVHGAGSQPSAALPPPPLQPAHSAMPSGGLGLASYFRHTRSNSDAPLPRIASNLPELMAAESGANSGLGGSMAAAPPPATGTTSNPTTSTSGGGGVGTGVGGAAPAIGVVLPRIGGVVSSEGLFPHGESGTSAASDAPRPLRCFAVPITYEDQRFALQLMCHLPLLFALPAVLRVPADVLTLRCAVSVRRVVFHATLYAAFRVGTVELSFASEPQFTATFDVHSGRGHRHAVPSSGGNPISGVGAAERMGTAMPPLAPMGERSHERVSVAGMGGFAASHRSKEKLQEIVDLAVRRAVQSITYPHVLQGRVRHTTARQVGVKETDAPDKGLVSWQLTKATLPLCC